MAEITLAEIQAEKKSKKLESDFKAGVQWPLGAPENVFNQTPYKGDSGGFGADGTREYGTDESSAGYGARASGPDFVNDLENTQHEKSNPYAEGDVLRRLASNAKQAGEEAEQRHEKQVSFTKESPKTKPLAVQVILSLVMSVVLSPSHHAKAEAGTNEINASDLKKQVSGSAMLPESDAAREKTFSARILSVKGVNLVVENNGHPLNVELKQVTHLKRGDKVQLRGTMVGQTLMAAGVRLDNSERAEHQ